MPDNQESKLEELIKQLLAATNAGNDARKDEADRAKEQRDKAQAKKDNKDKKTINQLRKADSSLTSLPIIGKMTKLISGTITATANKSLKLQETALARGSSLAQAMNQNSKVTDQLGGFMGKQVGNMQAIQTNFEMFAGGLGDASYETSRLVHATRLSSGQQKQLIAGLAKNTRGMGFTSEETSRLADTTLGMAQKYGVSTNELVNAVGGLASQLYDFAALGVGAEIQEAATVLAAGLGPAMAKVGPDLIGAFTKGDSMIQASLLGVSAERAELLKQGGDHTKAAIGLVVKGGANAERLIKQWTSGGMDRGLALQQLTQIYGKETTMLLAARNELQAQANAQGISLEAYTKQMQKEAKIKKEWQNTWQNFKDKVVSPLQEVVMGFVSFGLKLISAFGWLIKPLAQLGLGVVSLMMAVIAMRKAFILWQVAQKGIGMAKAGAGAVGGAFRGAKEALFNPLGKIFDSRMKGPKGGQWKGGAGKAHMMTKAPSMKDWKQKPGQFLGGLKNKSKGGTGGGGLGKFLGGLKNKFKEGMTGGGGGAAKGAATKAASVPKGGMGGGGLGKFLTGLGKGLKAIGKPAAMKGAVTLILLGASIAVAAIGFKQFAGVSWDQVAMGLTSLVVLSGIAVVLGKISKDIMKGSLAIGVLAISLIPLAFAFSLLAGISMGQMIAFAGVLIVLGVAAGVAGLFAANIILGSIAFLALGVSLIPLAFAFKLLKGVGIGTMFAFAGALIVLAIAAAGAAFIAPFIIAGAYAFGILGIALIPLAVALRIAAPAMDIFMTSLIRFKEVPLMKLLGFALVLPFLAAGMLTLGAVAGPILFLGIAMSLFIMPFMKLIMALTWLNDVPIGKMFLLGPALMSITYGLLAMTAGGIMTAAFDGLLKLFGVDSPIDKIVKMGKAAKHINKMAKTLKTLPNLLRQTVSEMAKIKLWPFYLLAHGLGIVKKSLDKFSLLDMLKFKMFRVQPPKQKAAPPQPNRPKRPLKSMGSGRVTRDKDLGIKPGAAPWGSPFHHKQLRDKRRGVGAGQGVSSDIEQITRRKQQSSWSLKSEGIGDIFMPKAGEAPAKVDQARIDRKKRDIEFLGGKAAEMREGGRGQRMVEETLQTLKDQLSYLKHIYTKQQEGNEINNESNEIAVEGNSDRREGHRTQRGRPTDRIAGAGVVGSLE